MTMMGNARRMFHRQTRSVREVARLARLWHTGELTVNNVYRLKPYCALTDNPDSVLCDFLWLHNAGANIASGLIER